MALGCYLAWITAWPLVAAMATQINMNPAVWQPDINMASGVSPDHEHLVKSITGNKVPDMNTDHSFSRAKDPDLVLGCRKGIHTDSGGSLGYQYQPVAHCCRVFRSTTLNSVQTTLLPFSHFSTYLSIIVVSACLDCRAQGGPALVIIFTTITL